MGRPQLPPQHRTCRNCGQLLPHGERDPLTGRLYRSDMQFCPHVERPKPVMPKGMKVSGYDTPASPHEAQFDPGAQVKSCKDEYWNRVEPGRLPALPYKDALPDPESPRPARLTERVTKAVLDRIGRIVKRNGQDREYALTLAMQTADDDLLDVSAAVMAGAIELERFQLGLEVTRDHGKRLDTARDFPRVAHLHDAPPTGPAPTGAQCPNCLQPDTEHMPACVVESGVDPDAVTVAHHVRVDGPIPVETGE